MSLIGTSLNAVSSNQSGSVIEFDVPRKVTAQVLPSGSSPSGTVSLEGSLDGVTFVPMSGSGFGVGGSLMSPASDHHVLFARATLSGFSGSPGDTVTVLIAGR